MGCRFHFPNLGFTFPPFLEAAALGGANPQPPISMFASASPEQYGGLGSTLITMDQEPSGGGYFRLWLGGNGANNVLADEVGPGFANSTRATAGRYFINNGYHAFGATFLSHNSRTAYYDGVAGVTDTAHCSGPVNSNIIRIGAATTTTPGEPYAEYQGCARALAIWKGVALSDDDHALLASGLRPDQLYRRYLLLYAALDNVTNKLKTLVWNGNLINPWTTEGADLVETLNGGTILTCTDDEPDFLPIPDILIGGTSALMEPVLDMYRPEQIQISDFSASDVTPRALCKEGLGSEIEIGPFRFSEQKQADETSSVSTLIIGLSQQEIGLVEFENWNDDPDTTEDWNTEVDLFGEDIYEDWGAGSGNSDDFTLELMATDDGISPQLQGVEVLDVIEDFGSTKQYSPLGYSAIFHRLKMSANEVDETFYLKFVDLAGQLTGRHR